MDIDNNITEELALIDIDAISETMSTIVEQGTDAVMDFFTSPEVALVLETTAEIGAELAKASKIITIIRKSASIPDKLFMKKMEKYCQGLVDIPVKKREKYIAKVGKRGLNKDSVFILGVLNKVEELSKIKMLVSLFEYKMDEIIDDETYRRLMLMVDRTMYSDLLYLKSNITDEPIVIENDAEQGLLGNGWLSYDGQTWGTATEDGDFIYRYTNIAKKFCELINI